MMKCLIISTFVVFLFLPPNVQAFLNIESLRQSSDMSERLSGSTQLGISDSNGNVNKTILKFSSLNMINRGKNNFIILGSYNYGRSSGNEDVNDGHLHFRLTRALSEGIFVEFFQQDEFNRFQDLKSRILLGSGLRQKLFKKLKHSLFLGGGVFYEKEDIHSSPNQNNPRGNFYLSYVCAEPKKYRASVVAYFQPNIERFYDQRVKLNLGLETYFGKYFVQQWSYTLARDSKPPAGVQKTESKISAQIGITY